MTHRDFPAGGLTDRGREWLAAGSPEGVPARLAATVQLLRYSPGGLEVFVLERVASMAFAPSMLVFPGGGVDERDAALPGLWFSTGPSAPALGLDDERVARQVVVAAVREVFEETGVLFAAPPADVDPGGRSMGELSGARAAALVPTRALAADRAALDARSATLAEVLDRHGLGLRTDLLVPVARWVTPHFEARRYDTFFFRARVPPGQEPDGATSEAARHAWVRPADALADFAAGTVRLLPPTIAAFEELARHATAAEALAAAPAHVPLVAPTLAETPEGLVIRVEPW